MASQIKERTTEEIKEKINSIQTDLSKLSYIEIAIKEATLNYDTKRYLLEISVKLYEKRKMYEKAAKSMINKASIDVIIKEKIESYLKAAELYSRGGKIEYAEDAFMRASREANSEQKVKVDLAKRNIYSVFAKELDHQGKKASALKFYEKLIKITHDPLEKQYVKKRLIEIYKSLGMFRESKLAEGL